MEWSYVFDPVKGILEVKVKVEISRSGLNEMAKHNLGEIKKHDCYKCLLDYRDTDNALELLDVYDRPKEIADLGITNRYRIALLVHPDRLKQYQFNETVYRNHNYAFRVFAERARALEYLSED